MLTLKKAEISDKNDLWNMLQNYLKEMSAYYDTDIDENGDYKYDYFNNYFTEKERIAVFIRDNKTTVGFVFINNYSCLGETIDYAVAEFTIFSKYRKNHCGLTAANLLFNTYRGKWELKFNNGNTAAKSFWIKATKKFSPRASSYEKTETVLSFATN